MPGSPAGSLHAFFLMKISSLFEIPAASPFQNPVCRQRPSLDEPELRQTHAFFLRTDDEGASEQKDQNNSSHHLHLPAQIKRGGTEDEANNMPSGRQGQPS